MSTLKINSIRLIDREVIRNSVIKQTEEQSRKRIRRFRMNELD